MRWQPHGGRDHSAMHLLGGSPGAQPEVRMLGQPTCCALARPHPACTSAPTGPALPTSASALQQCGGVQPRRPVCHPLPSGAAVAGRRRGGAGVSGERCHCARPKLQRQALGTAVQFP